MIAMKPQGFTAWDVKNVFKRSDRNKYAYRVMLTFTDGTTQTKMFSGFATKKEAEDARKKTIGEIANGTFVVQDRVTLAELLEYWLEYDLRKRAQSCNTYDTYKNIINRHIIPFIGKKYITDVNKGDIQRLYKDRTEFSIYISRQVKAVLNVFFDYAVQYNYIPVNPGKRC